MNEAENTLRALKDQAPLVTRFLCYVGKHKWTQYTEPTDEKRSMYTFRIQQRHCAGCGLYNEKTLWKHVS
jgi:hypothetical protein